MKTQKILLAALGIIAFGVQQTTLSYVIYNETSKPIDVWATSRANVRDIDAQSITTSRLESLRASKQTVAPGKDTAWNQDHKELRDSEEVIINIKTDWERGNLVFVTSKRAGITISEEKDKNGKFIRIVANRCLLNEKTGQWDLCADVNLEVKDKNGIPLYYIDNTPVNACLTQFIGNPFALAKCLSNAANK